MAPSKIVIFLGTVRPGRMVERVSIALKNLVASQGMEPVVLDPAELPFEIVSVPLHFMKEPEKEAPEWLLEVNNKIQSADGFIVVSAEYNCGIPPALSNMLDHFPPTSFRHRPCGIITYSPGPRGGVRAQVVLRPLLSELGMVSTPYAVSVADVHKTIEEDGKFASDRVCNHLTRLVKEVGWYADALKKQGERNPPPPGSWD